MSRAERSALIHPTYDTLDTRSEIPGRACMWLLSWVFVGASVGLTAEFIVIHQKTPPQDPQLANFLGSLEAILWLQGFILLMYWSLYEVPFQFSSCLGTLLKLLASVFFNLQPGSGLLNEELGPLKFNFVGICLFHTGNLVSCYAMQGLFDKKRPYAESNLPVYGMWIYTLATTFLVTADGIDNYIPHEPSVQNFVKCGQIFGAVLLGVGSLIYAYWSRPKYYLPPYMLVN
eukprot:m.232246 g.232246  ORF g.232246 m.232246 type:complete len:231 (+) comp19272_c0_seq8:298-990(+)